MAYRSRQRRYGGGKFQSERQRRAIWASSPELGHLWAHNMDASGHRSQWAKVRVGATTHAGKSVGTTRRMATKSAPRMSVGAGRRFSAGGRGSFTRRGPRRR